MGIQREVPLLNYVDDYCCPQRHCMTHDMLCPDRGSNHLITDFYSGNGSFHDIDQGIGSLKCTRITTKVSPILSSKHREHGKKTKRAKKKNTGGRQSNIADLRAPRSILKATEGLTNQLDAIIDRQGRTRIQDPPNGKKSRSASNKQNPKVTPKPTRKRKAKKDCMTIGSKDVSGGLSPQTQSQLKSLMAFGE